MPRVKDRIRSCKWCESQFELGQEFGQYRYCSVECRKRWHAANHKTAVRTARDPRQQKNYWLKNKYGITIEDFESKLKDQDNTCPICCEGIGWSAHVDHCHETGQVRKLLCGTCNQALGLLKEDVEIMKRMIMYVQSN